jgi:hypothetical protein
MKRFVVFLVAVAIVATMLGAFPALVRADDGVPFKGRAELTLTAMMLQGNILSLTYVGTGQGTHLGRFKEDASLVVDLSTGAVSASVTLTAANGDKVFKSATGTVLLPFASGDFTILGGTGRFEDATGTGDVEMVFSDDLTHAAQTYEGTIEF